LLGQTRHLGGTLDYLYVVPLIERSLTL